MATKTIERVDERAAAISLVEDAWTEFRAAVLNTDGSAVVGAYIRYHRARHAVLDRTWFPDPQDNPTPPSDGVWQRLLNEHAYLTGWAPAVRTGSVPGTAANPAVRLITPEERAEYQRRADEYLADLAVYNTLLDRYATSRGEEPPGKPGPNSAGWAKPAIPPMTPPVYPLQPPVLPGADNFNAALTLALSE